jgi:hypothetical protein
VWKAFADRFAWVAGVAGNHDDVTAIHRSYRVHLLDRDRVKLGGVRLGGVGLMCSPSQVATILKKRGVAIAASAIVPRPQTPISLHDQQPHQGQSMTSTVRVRASAVLPPLSVSV